MVWIEFALVIGCILIGARIGGVGLGAAAGVGLSILVFAFHLPPGSPPVNVLFMILAVVTAASTMQAAGGLDYLVGLADRALRAKPKWITFMAPIVCYLFTLGAGTGHVAYSVLPVIAEVSRKAGVRPERPLSISVIASQQAITACPISAATVALLGLLSDQSIGLGDILMICIPSTFAGCMAGALAVYRWGKELDEDEDYQALVANGMIETPKATSALEGKELARARGSVIVFGVAAIGVVFLGMFPGLRPSFEVVKDGATTVGTLSMAQAIMMTMLAAAGVIMLVFRAGAEATVRGSIMRAGSIALISIFGLAWMGSSFFEGNRTLIVESISGVVTAYPWVFAIGLFVLSILLYSQAATTIALMPVGIALGLSAPSLIAMFPAVNGYFFLPTYGTIVAAISFDQTKTTRIGKYLLNHSFMLPGIVATVVAVSVGFLLAGVLL